MEVTRALAKNIADMDYENLPAATVDMTKKIILDTLGVAVAGNTGSGMRELAELIREWRGKEESTIVGFGGRVPSVHAALVNGSMGRALDFDDTHDLGGLHAGVPAVFAGFATAEAKGNVSGKQFITAVALGIDLSCRMGVATDLSVLEGYGWDYTSLYGYFAAAATSGKILNFSEEQLLNAIGIAYYQAGGNLCEISSGDTTKAMGSGFAASRGVMSALMVNKGLTGCKESLVGEMGLFDVYQRGTFTPEALTEDLGKIFQVEANSFKPYPCCRVIHAFIDATLDLVKEHGITPERVDQVIAYSGHGGYRTVCLPIEIKQRPPNVIASEFSIPWALANAITYQEVKIKHFTAEAIANEDVLQLSEKVITKLDDSLTRHEVEPAIVEIRTKDGKVHSKRVEYGLGHPKNPFSIEGLQAKFRDCVSYSAKPILEKHVEETIERVSRLEDITDVSEIIRLFG